MEIDFEKMGGLVPAIIQDAVTKNVLMLGFMNKEAYDKTIEGNLLEPFTQLSLDQGRDLRKLPQSGKHSDRLRQRHLPGKGSSRWSYLPQRHRYLLG